MDVPRTVSKTKKYLWRTFWGILFTGLLIGVTLALKKMEPAAPSVDKGTVWTDKVVRGDMVRMVRGTGSLVPVDIRFITPATNGRVEKILIEPGTMVTNDTVIMELSSPELELSLQEAKLELKTAESQYSAMKVQIENEILDLQTAAAKVEADYEEAKLRAKSDEELAKEGLIAVLQLKVTKVRAAELEKMKQIEQQRVKVKSNHAKTQLEVLQAKIDQTKAALALKEEQVKSLIVRAGTNGVLVQKSVEIGHQVTTATLLAKISDPSKLKAVLRIDQNQAREVLIGQNTSVDIRSKVLKGKVTRIDPAVLEGSVLVDITLLEELPAGARPDLSLVGTIEIEKLENILYAGRPMFGEPNGTASLFKLSADGLTAMRTPVKFGRSSVNTIEIVSGLKEGDKIILSDMTEWDKVDKIRLK